MKRSLLNESNVHQDPTLSSPEDSDVVKKGSMEILTVTRTLATKHQSHQPKSMSKPRYILSLIIALTAFTCTGVHPVLARYLQKNGGLDTRQSSAVIGISTSIVFCPFGVKYFSEILRIKKRILVPFILLHAVSTTLEPFATHLTLAFYVQTIRLSVPFWVALFCYIMKDPIPRYTIPAVILASIGAFLTITGDGLEMGEFRLSKDDVFGISLSICSNCFRAAEFYLIMKVHDGVPVFGLVWLESVTDLVQVPLSIFVYNNDWMHAWGKLDTATWTVFIVSILASMFGGFGRVYTIRTLTAAFASSMSPWELVAAFALGVSPFLNEPFGVLNIIGVTAITIIMTVYLSLKYRDEVKHKSLLPAE